MSRGSFGGIWDENDKIGADGEERSFSKSEKDSDTVLVFGTDARCDERADRKNSSSSKIKVVNCMILDFRL